MSLRLQLREDATSAVLQPGLLLGLTSFPYSLADAKAAGQGHTAQV